MREISRALPWLRLPLAASLAVPLIFVTACASVPPAPTASMDAAKVAITNAEQADAGNHAGTELEEARRKLALADAAVLEEEMLVAEQLAEQARLDAELASARTDAAKAAAVNEELGRGADALIEEMQRTGDNR
jgi:hypothetical protein